MAKHILFESDGHTHVGRVRSTNQDSFLVDEKNMLFIIADGMGGHAGGEIASRLCIQEISSYLRNQKKALTAIKDNSHPNSELMTIMSEAINYSSAKIYDRALEDPTLRGMGTTATVLKIQDNFAYIAHVGDSRLYLIRCGFIYQITFDHSLVSEQVRAGIITPEEAELHHLRNVITRSVGYQEEEHVDTTFLELENDDYLLICSDGLNKHVNDQEISNMLSSKGISATNDLIELTNERGGEDNVSVVVVKINEVQ